MNKVRIDMFVSVTENSKEWKKIDSEAHRWCTLYIFNSDVPQCSK